MNLTTGTVPMKKLTLFTIIIIAFSLGGCGNSLEVGQWKRLELSFRNNSWSGNPFDLDFTGTFTAPSGRTLTQIGFYAGQNTWKIYFMPDETGTWTFRTESSDPDLDGKSDSFQCTASDITGELVPDGNRWAFMGDGGAFPVIWSPPVPDGAQWGFRGRDLSDPDVQNALRFADEVVGADLLGFGALLIKPLGWAEQWPQSAVPYVIGKEGDTFNLPFWDQLNAKLDSARDRGMGAYIMLYSDDEQTPDHFGVTPRSQKELRFFRYTIARLACYPKILWDTGIDIGEYRSKDWINWYAQWFRAHDPWEHPVGSRTGGGSGGSMPEAGTYYSTGGASIPSRATLLHYLQMDVPVAHTDHWRIFISRGHWTNDKIRIVHWRCALSGFQALYPDYNQGEVVWDQVQTGGKYIGYATRFFKTMVRSDLRDLNPHDDLIAGGDSIIVAANPGHEYILYDQNGGEDALDLHGTDSVFNGLWYNPRTGEKQEIQPVNGGDIVRFESPTSGKDWALLLQETP